MKTAVIYWSGTGNTQMMATAVAEGCKGELFEVSSFTGDISEYDAIALGCPSMGAEELEENEFEPFFISVQAQLKGKKVLLFGSYGWGDGEWMRNWVERTQECGAYVYKNEGIIVNETPSDEDLTVCRMTAAGFVN
ncbi:MAG: flavodoxin [Oscillospiraceae bacterium]|nr:flavodoxin [Oscillospiraceae bacterium]